MATNHLVLSWKDHNGSLISVFENLMKNNSLTDCTLAAEGQYLKAHKIVLSACSSYFELLFSQESERNPIVILKDVKFQELEAAVNFMYRGEVKVREDRLAAFLEVAESLQIKGLGCVGETLRLRENLSTLSEKISSQTTAVAPQQHPRKDALNFPSDSAGECPNVPATCDPVRNNENSAVHQSFQSECSRYSPTLPPPSSFFYQSGQNTQNDQNCFENSQNSWTASPQFVSGENEQSDTKPVIKIEPVTDVCAEEKSEEVDMDFVDELTKLEDQEDWDEHNDEIMNDEHSNSQQEVGAECDVDPEGPYKQRPSRTATRFIDAGTTSRFTNIVDIPVESLDSSLQPQERPQSKTYFLSERPVVSNVGVLKRTRLSDTNRVHKCPHCDYTTMSKSSITAHLRKHTREQPYECAYCARKFSTKGNLTTHIRIHMGEKPLQCPECDYKSSESSALKLHRRSHTGEKPYQCSECDFKTSHSSTLRRHRRIHTGEKPYQCSECDFKTSDSSHLARHRRIHTGGKPYQCSECDFKSSDSSALKKHRRIHTGEKPYQCPEYDYRSRQIGPLTRH